MCAWHYTAAVPGRHHGRVAKTGLGLDREMIRDINSRHEDMFEA